MSTSSAPPVVDADKSTSRFRVSGPLTAFRPLTPVKPTSFQDNMVHTNNNNTDTTGSESATPSSSSSSSNAHPHAHPHAKVKVSPPKSRSLFTEFALGGSSTMLACVFTNPIEVVKTRMQLQGELGGHAKSYRNPIHAFYTIAKQEGIRGLQGGLGPAALYQLTMNGTRLGLYEPLKKFISANDPLQTHQTKATKQEYPVHSPPVWYHNVIAAATSGVIAAVVGSPFFLVKVRLQVQSKSHTPVVTNSNSTTVGHQHKYTGAFDGLKKVYQSDGFFGLYRGASAAMIRVGIASAVQLSTYDHCKHFVLERTGWSDGVKAHFAASLISGIFVTLAMNPPDVISTRLYNQPVQNGKGLLYTSISDCFVKTIRAEGIGGLYKGYIAHYLRLGPHTILTFVFWEQAKAFASRFGL